MTKQETFDTVVAHLRKQGARAETLMDYGDDEPVCVYRAPNGMKCAAGCLIPDDKYKSTFEKTRVGVYAGTEVTRVIRELGHAVDLVSELQGVHDAHSPEFWEARFKEVARAHGLVYSPVTGGQA